MQQDAPKGTGTRAPEGSLAVPLKIQLEIALQNQRLAELRYKASVKRGRAWDMVIRKPATAK